jgi:hypothetical protein
MEFLKRANSPLGTVNACKEYVSKLDEKKLNGRQVCFNEVKLNEASSMSLRTDQLRKGSVGISEVFTLGWLQQHHGRRFDLRFGDLDRAHGHGCCSVYMSIVLLLSSMSSGGGQLFPSRTPLLSLLAQVERVFKAALNACPNGYPLCRDLVSLRTQRNAASKPVSVPL